MEYGDLLNTMTLIDYQQLAMAKNMMDSKTLIDHRMVKVQLMALG
jgi:hypothetical protein